MRCDGRTFTETNGNIVSEKADRAVNRRPITEQINISKNSSAFSDRLCARQQMHQALSGHFSLQMSYKTGRCEGGSHGQALSSNSDHQAEPAPEVLLFCVLQSNVSESELSPPLSSIMRSLSWCLWLSWVTMLSLPHRGQRLLSTSAVWCQGPVTLLSCTSLWILLVQGQHFKPQQWCTAVKTKLIFLTDRQSIMEHQIRRV